MTMKLTTQEKGNVIIVHTSGKLTLGDGSSALREKMRKLIRAGFRRILLDMADVTYIDSSGLGELVAAYTTVTNAGGEMKLLNLCKRIDDLLTITKLYTVFDTFEDEAWALRSFSVDKEDDLQVRNQPFKI
jgi:anti-sigma B factor antagonist